MTRLRRVPAHATCSGSAEKADVLSREVHHFPRRPVSRCRNRAERCRRTATLFSGSCPLGLGLL